MKEFSKKTNLLSKVNTCDSIQISKVPPPIPPRLSKKVLEKSKFFQKNLLVKGDSQMLYAQVASYISNTLKIKEAFPDLPNKKVLEIHNIAFAQSINKTRKIQHTTKGLSRKQAIIPVPLDLTKNIMGDTSTHIFQINVLLKNIKLMMHSEFCQRAKLCARIKLTALCSVFDKENSIEFPLDSVPYIYIFWLTLTLLKVLCFPMSHFTLTRPSIRKEKKKKRNINNDLADLPSHDKFICPCSSRIAIITNNVPNPSNLSIIEKYFKSSTTMIFQVLGSHNQNHI